MKKLPTLRGRTVVNLFFESSTRTSSSFELAAKRLSADTMSIKAAGSSVDKGESLKDTALTLDAYDPDVIVIRHPQIGAPQLVARVTDAHVVNAGRRQAPAPDAGAARPLHDPAGARPDRGPARRDRRRRAPLARRALEHPGARAHRRARDARRPAGADPARDRGDGLRGLHDIGAIADADVVYVLRMQRERMQAGANYVPSLREYTARWGVTPERLRPGQKVMHPGPDEPRRRDRPAVADAADALIETRCAPGSSSAWPSSTTCSRTARSRVEARSEEVA